MKAANKIVDAHGDITREDFTKFTQDTKLTDFHVAEGAPLQKQNSTKWQPTSSKMEPYKTHPDVKPSGGKLLCCYSTASEVMSPRAHVSQVQGMLPRAQISQVQVMSSRAQIFQVQVR